MCKDLCLKIEDAFGTHVEQEVEDAQVGQETVTLLIDLIIRTGGEIGIGKRMLRVDGVAKIGDSIGLFRVR